jgi:hypothetical protein
MNIADNCDWRRDVDDVTFAHEDVFDLFANCFEDFFTEEFSFLEFFDAFI